MAKSTQKDRTLLLKSPLGDDLLLPTSFSGHEEMSRLFSFQLRAISTNDAIAADQIVGKPVTVTIKFAKGSSKRFFHGHVSRFSAGGMDSGFRDYDMEIVPWFWFLTQNSDCRIFQDKTVKDIIEDVFKRRGFKDVDTSGIKGQHKQWSYCVQYRETDFNFVSRLMEQEGIYYYFKHEENKHTLVLADDAKAYYDLSENEVDYEYDLNANDPKSHVVHWQHQYEFCSGKWAQTDYNFETPALSLTAQKSSKVPLPSDASKYEIFDFPGEYWKKSEGDTETQIRMEEEELQYNQARGGGNCKTFSPGGKFKLKKHPAKSENQQYVITSINHSANEPSGYTGESGGAEYSNDFTCVPASVVFRPARTTPKPIVSGVQTAVVVGPKGEEIHCDKYGRVKVQFHWDRVGKKDEKSSCWIRVANNVAGRKWGFMAIPRIGQEVVIEFLEGDPDEPLIVGSVYNADQMPHYDLPANQTKTYIKTNSSKGGDGFNELFFEDKKDSERIFLHAQKDMDVRVRNDAKERIYGNSHQIVGYEKDGKKGGDQREMVYQDKQVNVKRHQVEHIEGNLQLMVGGGEATDGGNVALVVEKQTAISIGQQGLSLKIDGDKREKVGGAQSLTVVGARKEKSAKLSTTVDGACNEKVGSHSLQVGQNQNIKVGMNQAIEAGQAIHIKGGMNVVIEAGMTLTLKVGGNFVAIGPAGVDIQGTLVKINSGGAAGSGSGCSPEAPESPAAAEDNVTKAKPTKPDKAHKEKTGNKSC